MSSTGTEGICKEYQNLQLHFTGLYTRLPKLFVKSHQIIKYQFISEGVQNCWFWVVANLNICLSQFIYCYRFNHFSSMFLFNTPEIIRNFQIFVMNSESIERKYLKEVCSCYHEGSSIQYVRKIPYLFFSDLLLWHLVVSLLWTFCSCQMPQKIG